MEIIDIKNLITDKNTTRRVSFDTECDGHKHHKTRMLKHDTTVNENVTKKTKYVNGKLAETEIITATDSGYIREKEDSAGGKTSVTVTKSDNIETRIDVITLDNGDVIRNERTEKICYTASNPYITYKTFVETRTDNTTNNIVSCYSWKMEESPRHVTEYGKFGGIVKDQFFDDRGNVIVDRCEHSTVTFTYDDLSRVTSSYLINYSTTIGRSDNTSVSVSSSKYYYHDTVPDDIRKIAEDNDIKISCIRILDPGLSTTEPTYVNEVSNSFNYKYRSSFTYNNSYTMEYTINKPDGNIIDVYVDSNHVIATEYFDNGYSVEYNAALLRRDDEDIYDTIKRHLSNIHKSWTYLDVSEIRKTRKVNIFGKEFTGVCTWKPRFRNFADGSLVPNGVYESELYSELYNNNTDAVRW